MAKGDTHVCLCASNNHILVTVGGYNELTIIYLYYYSCPFIGAIIHVL